MKRLLKWSEVYLKMVIPLYKTLKYECQVLNVMVLFKNNNSTNSLIILSLFHTGSYDLSDDMLVMLYSYYKQATVGPCNTIKPNSWDPIGKAKW